MSVQPEIGSWYRCQDALFEIVAIDERADTLELQYFDGTVEEWEREQWDTLATAGRLRLTVAPEDTAGSLDAADEREATGELPADPPRGDGLQEIEIFAGNDPFS